MPKLLTKPAVLRDSWRPNNVAQLRAQNQQLAVRLTFTALLGSLVAIALFLVFAPLFHPTTRLFFLTAGASNPSRSAPVAFFQDDALRFLTSTGSLKPAAAVSHLLFLESPEAFRSALERVTASVTKPADVAIVHLSAHPLLIQQLPYLRCDNYDPDRPLEGAVACEELFDHLSGLTSGHVVVLLETGNLTDQESLFVDDVVFFDRLEDLLTAHASPNYTIILSHSVGEESYRSTSLKCSVFALAASLGLSGLADLDSNRRITADEFFRFVAGTTHAIVQQESGGAAGQHPQLSRSQLASPLRLTELVIGSAPPKGPNKQAEQYGVQLSTAGQANIASAPAPPVVTDASQADPEKTKQQTFQNSLSEYAGRKSDEINEDLNNELNLLIIGLPKPLARGLRRSVDEAQKLSDKRDAPSAGGNDKPSGNPSDGKATSPPATSPLGTPDDANPSSEASDTEPALIRGFPDLSKMADSDMLGMLRLAWDVTVFLERADMVKSRPLDLAPVPWLNWRTHLHALEERIRTGAMIDERQMRLELTSEILGAYQLAHGKPVAVGNCMKSISQEISPLPIPLSTISSFGAGQNLHRFGLLTFSVEIEKAQNDFDRCLMSTNREALDKWLTESVPADAGQFVEVLYSRMLLSDASIPWTIAQPLLKARRDYELFATHPMIDNPALRDELSMTQRHLLQATRLALDHISSDWNSHCLQALAHAQASLTTIQRQLRIYRDAWQWRNQVLLDVPALITWLQIDTRRLNTSVFGQTNLGRITQKELPKLLDELAALTSACHARETTTANSMESLLRQAQSRYTLIRQSWLDEFEGLKVRNNDSKSMMASDAWVVDALLASTIVIGPERNQLLQWRVKAATLPELTAQTSLISAKAAADSTAATRLRGSLLSKLARMGNLAIPELEEPWALNDTFAQLRVVIPSLISAAAGQEVDDRRQSLRQADVLQRLWWQSSKLSEANRPLNRELWRTEFVKLCHIHHQLSAGVFEDAVQDELRFWPDFQLRLAQLESLLSGKNVSFPTRRNQIIGQGPSRLSLVTNPEASGRIVWKNAGPDMGNVWLVVDYDRDNLELVADTTLPYYTVDQLPALLQDALATTEQQLVNQLTSGPPDASTTDELSNQIRSQIEAIRHSTHYPVRPLAGWMAPSAGLAAGQSLTIPFKVHRIGSSLGSSKIVWKLISDREYVRYEIAVDRADSKQLRLVSDGPVENWTENADGLVLHPWPNRATEFRIGLINAGAARVVSLELFRLMQRGPVALPNGFVDANVSREIANRLGNIETLQTIADIAIPESPGPYWLTLQAEQPAALAKPNASAPVPSIAHGAVVVLTDKTTGEKLWRKIDFRVRHPRSYVEPRVRYDSVSERVIIQMRPFNGQALPPSGVNIHGECLSSLPSGTEKRLDGLLTGASPLELICQIPPRAGRKITMALDVDQFPRAFVFDVPCWETQTEIPLMLDKQRLSFVHPQNGLLLPGSAQRQDVTLRVDAFPGAFATSRDVIEIGWDLDRDREFTDESTLKIYSDRNVDVELGQLKGDRLVVTARVKDVQLSIPAPTLRGANINLLARMSSAGETVWSQPVEVIADDQAPTITGVELNPDIVIKQGEELTLTIGADDQSLSGLATVQFQVDRQLAGLWDAKGQVVDCRRTPEGSWVGVLPTTELAPGRTIVLAMATDRAGNASQLRKTHFELLSVDEWQARQANAGLEVTGSISYSGGPLGGARLTLENDKGEIVYQARANAQGIFQFPKVAVGTYKLVGTGVVKNRSRRAESDIEVKQTAAAPLRLQLLAK